jgi:hypothetical protein
MIRGVVLQRIMNAILMMVGHVIADQPTKMLFVQGDDVVQESLAGNFPPSVPPDHFARAPERWFASVSDLSL